MADRALVRNAADPEQVKRAGRKVRDREALLMAALKETLRYESGRLVLSELLDRAGLYATSLDSSGSMVYFKEGRRNFGLEIRAACESADEEATDLMDRERRARIKRMTADLDEAHVAGHAETEASNVEQ